jgi:hypothetical protein
VVASGEFLFNRAPTPILHNQSRAVTNGTPDTEVSAVEKCQVCQFYDRQNVKSNDGKSATQWGQCRREAPMLHPINAKSYMIEGVWPHVRDDDWCGEWKMATRRSDTRVTEVSAGPHGPGSNPLPPSPMSPSMPPRVAPLSMPSSHGASPSIMPLPGLAMVASGRGD